MVMAVVTTSGVSNSVAAVFSVDYYSALCSPTANSAHVSRQLLIRTIGQTFEIIIQYYDYPSTTYSVHTSAVDTVPYLSIYACDSILSNRIAILVHRWCFGFFIDTGRLISGSMYSVYVSFVLFKCRCPIQYPIIPCRRKKKFCFSSLIRINLNDFLARLFRLVLNHTQRCV
jgi:hypothetical protein